MAHRLGVAKAARILGISRTALQQLIRNGDLSTFEGEVDFDELRQRFPALAFNQSPEIERASIIKDTAFGERVQQRVAPSSETLERQIRRLKVDLNVERVKSRKYQLLIVDLMEKITELQQAEATHDDALLQDLNAWLLERFNK